MATSAGAIAGWKLRRLKLTPYQRLWAYITKTSKYKCWEWPGNRFPNGYGQIRINGRNSSTHRLSWESTYGSIPKGMFVCHKCDNRLCCNPNHLFLGTQSDNISDCVRKGRNNHCKGESHYASKFTAKDIIRIRNKYASGGVTQKMLASEYRVRHGTISKICLMQRWAHIK